MRRWLCIVAAYSALIDDWLFVARTGKPVRARRIEWDGQHMNETFRLRGLLGRDDGQQAFDDLTLDVDQDWLPHTADAQPGRDERLLDIARETLQSNAGIPADQ